MLGATRAFGGGDDIGHFAARATARHWEIDGAPGTDKSALFGLGLRHDLGTTEGETAEDFGAAQEIVESEPGTDERVRGAA